MQQIWAQVATSPVKAEDARKLAESARDGMQSGLDDLAFAAATQDAAFSGWACVLSHGGHGGVLFLELTVLEDGRTGPTFFESARIGGCTEALIGLMNGRPRALASYRLPMVIGAHYFTDRPSDGTGADDSEGERGQPVNHDFTVNVSEGGRATTTSQDDWLLKRGGDNAATGAQSLFDAMQGWGVTLAKL
jgi:hypothetical protein